MVQKPKVPEIEIRGHHLLCIQGFRGYGYNEEFISNMKEVVDKIKSVPDLQIKMTDKCDKICTPCPHKINNECSKEIVKHMDSQVMRTLGIKIGEMIKFKDVLSKIKDNSQELKMACKDCEWEKVCLFVA